MSIRQRRNPGLSDERPRRPLSRVTTLPGLIWAVGDGEQLVSRKSSSRNAKPAWLTGPWRCQYSLIANGTSIITPAPPFRCRRYGQPGQSSSRSRRIGSGKKGSRRDINILDSNDFRVNRRSMLGSQQHIQQKPNTKMAFSGTGYPGAGSHRRLFSSGPRSLSLVEGLAGPLVLFRKMVLIGSSPRDVTEVKSASFITMIGSGWFSDHRRPIRASAPAGIRYTGNVISIRDRNMDKVTEQVQHFIKIDTDQIRKVVAVMPLLPSDQKGPGPAEVQAFPPVKPCLNSPSQKGPQAACGREIVVATTAMPLKAGHQRQLALVVDPVSG